MAAPKKNQTKSQPPATVQNFPIVGIGASAGGLDAFKRLLTAIPDNSGMAYVLVQHLDPTHESILPEILQRVTKIPVHEITDDIHLAPDHIYIIPSNKILTSTDGVLQITPREKKIINLSIDIFFTSLAEVHKEFAVGVVLSGTGTDGTLGLKAIKEHGGISMAQDSESAAYDSMPQSAVNAGVVDFILAPEKIPEQLLQINSSYKTNHFFKEEEQLSKTEEDIFKQILLLLRQRSGVDFTYYKQPTFHRRIARRITITKNKNLADYLKFLRTDNSEQDALFHDVLIPVTSFFRDPKTFQALTETVFPALFKNKAADQPVRVWIAGCSTGEEAFSIAISLYEYLTLTLSKGEGTKIQIFGTDISEKVIKKARAGIYTKADVEKLSETQLRNYFIKSNAGYQLKKLIRDMCVFAPHNFLKDPPFAKMDLITCRNVLIYMDTFLQKKAFTTFHYALKENGFLLLGKSETTGASSDLFTQVEKHEKIYSRKPVQGRFMHVATERKEEFFVTKDLTAGQAGKTATKLEVTQTDYRKSAEAIMISKSPASVVVNEAMDIVHIHGDITPFLQAPQGKPTHNLLKMAREGLAFELRNAIHKATKEQATVTKANIPVKTNGKQSVVTMEIIPLTDTIEPYYLVRFKENIIPVVQEEKKLSSGKTIETSRELSGQNEKLEKELSQTREDMRSITEDMEAANEELQSANEELQSSNEEMQSLNEELETSKEELQSTNEELTIVNQELLDKQEQLNASYLEQVNSRKQIEASEKEQKKLASQLKLATDSAKVGIWSLDIPSSKLEWSNTHKKMWGYSEHREGLAYEDWHKVIVPEDKELAFQRIEESKVNHAIYDVDYRITRANDGAIVWVRSTGQYYYDEFGVAHTLTGISVDISEQKIAAEQIRQSEEKFKSIFENSLTAILITDDHGNYLSVNKAASELLGYSVNELLQMNVGDLQTTSKPGAALRFEEYISKGEETGEFDFITKNGACKFGQYQSRRLKADFNLCIMMDITERKEAAEKLKATAIELATKNKLIEESEARSRALIESNVVPVCFTQTETATIFEANDAFLDMLGYTRQDLKEGKINWLTYTAPEFQVNEHLAIEKAKSMKVTAPYEKEIIRTDGKRLSVIKARAFINKDEIMSVFVDITERKAAEQKLKTFSEELIDAKTKAENATAIAENAVVAKQQFLSNMSHEIRTPMNAIIGFTKVLMKTAISEKQKEYVQAIKASGNTLIVLINDILDLAKVDAGKMIFVNTPFKMEESITTILHLFEIKIQEKNIALIKEYDSRIPQIVLGDSIRLHQILINLLSNAIKFTAKGRITISVYLLNEDEEKVTIEIKVSDTGIGIPQDKIATIFEIFEQAQNITSSLYGGTGLGLAIVKQLVEKQGGTISIESKPDEGSTFGFMLSFQKNKTDTESYREEDGEVELHLEMNDIKVLVVEDVKLNQLLMTIILDNFKFKYDVADNGKIAVEKLQTNSYDIILMDLQMPVMNGFEATEYIRNTMNLQIPIIALTADVTTMDAESCKAVGMNDYISKPFDEKILYSKIVDLIKSR